MKKKNNRQLKEDLLREVLSTKKRNARLVDPSYDFNQISDVAETPVMSEKEYLQFEEDITNDYIKPTQKHQLSNEEAIVQLSSIQEQASHSFVGFENQVEQISHVIMRQYYSNQKETIIGRLVLSGQQINHQERMIEFFAKKLSESRLIISPHVEVIDMSKYVDSTQETLFVQDMYAMAQSDCTIVLIKNLERAHQKIIDQLCEVMISGKLELNKRYQIANQQLKEVTSSLVKQTIKTLYIQDKLFVIQTDSKKSLEKVIVNDVLVKLEFIDSFEALKRKQIEHYVQEFFVKFEKRISEQLQLTLVFDQKISDYLVDSLNQAEILSDLSRIEEILHNQLVDLKLHEATLPQLISCTYDNQVLLHSKALELFQPKDMYDINDLKNDLKNIVGLDEVKDYLCSLYDLMQVQQFRKKRGLKVSDISKHMIFLGNPGTGKTMIARTVCKILKSLDIVEKGQLIEVSRQDLVGKYVGHTAPLTMEKVNMALGGVLFVDEAYALHRGNDDSFGTEAIDTLVKAMEDYRDKFIVILAGYSKEMGIFLEANSGLNSRFPNKIEFADYNAQELLDISHIMAKSQDYFIDVFANPRLLAHFEAIQSQKDFSSGNARYARNLVEKAILNQSRRIMSNPDADFSQLLYEDFELPVDSH